MNRVQSLLTRCLMAGFFSLLMLSCMSQNDAQAEHSPEISLDSYECDSTYKHLRIKATLKNCKMPHDLSDSIHTRYESQCYAYMNDLMPAHMTAKVVGVENVAKRQLDSLNAKILVLVDLTVPQPAVIKSMDMIRQLQQFFKPGSIYVSFLSMNGEISPTTPFMDDMYQSDFVSCIDSGQNKYLYRSIYDKIVENESPKSPMGDSEHKAILVCTDGLTWGVDAPYDPDHFDMKKALLDLTSDPDLCSMTVFYAPVAADDEDVVLNNTMKIVCDNTHGGVIREGDVSQMHETLCYRYGVEPMDMIITLENPDLISFHGENITYNISFIQQDSLQITGTIPMVIGSLYDTVVVNGIPNSLFILYVLSISILAIVLVYAIMQFLLPYVNYRIFRKRYVVRYTGPGMSVAGHQVGDTCYFCKTKFEEGDMVVAKCDHAMHMDCWEENGYKCPEYGVGCMEGSYYYNRHNLLDRRNSSFIIKWLMLVMLSTLGFWLAYNFMFQVLDYHVVSWLMEQTMGTELESKVFAYNYIDPVFAVFYVTSMVCVLAFLSTPHVSLSTKLLETGARCLVGAVVGFLLTFLLLVIALCMPFYSLVMSLIFQLIYDALMFVAIVLTVLPFSDFKISSRKLMLALGVAVLLYLPAITLYLFVGVDMRMLLYVVWLVEGIWFVLMLAFDRKAHEHSFLRVTGCVKPMDVAIYKWLINDPHQHVLIGRSVDCNLQIVWDLQSDVAPVQALIRHYRRGYLCLEARERGVYDSSGKELKVGQPLELFHGTRFTIGTTSFKYFEK